MDECLPYFRAALERPETVPAWPTWWREHQHRVEEHFDPADYELLRTGNLEAAAMILRRGALALPSRVQVVPVWSTPSLSEDGLAEFERGRGTRLPEDYRNFLLAYNGGYVRPCWFRLPPSERAILMFFGVGGVPLSNALQFFPHLPGEYLPMACPNAPGSLVGSEDQLLIDKGGTVWFWPADPKQFRRESLVRVAGSFEDLLVHLDYPERAKPWMEYLDLGDLAGFRRWAEAGGDFRGREPASGMTPIEYAALARDCNLMLGQLWVNEEGKRRREARREMVRLLVELGAEPGCALSFAVTVRNYEIAWLLPLDRVGADELSEARQWLREWPATDASLLAAIEEERKARKRARRRGPPS